MKATRFHIYVIGTLLLNVYMPGARAQLTEQTEFTGQNKMVIVEPTNIVTVQQDGNYSLLPYRDRRPKWGSTVSVSYSTYEPTDYEPNFLQAEFADVYSFPEVPMIELNYAFKRNGAGLSYGAELSVGIYQNSSGNQNLAETSLQLIPIKLGAIVLLDSLAPTPFFVPYVAGGGYVMIYHEDNNSTSFSGNTQVAPYVNAGVAVSLDWIDKRASRVSYEDSAIQATYAFVEARTMLEGGDDQDPDFSSPVSVAGGLKVEF